MQRLSMFEEQQGGQCVWSRETGMGNEERGADDREGEPARQGAGK